MGRGMEVTKTAERLRSAGTRVEQEMAARLGERRMEKGEYN